MGGNALKSTFTRRYKKQEFEDLFKELKPILLAIFGTKVELVKSYTNKESFGDIDILVFNTGFEKKQVFELLTRYFGDIEIHHNHNVYSFAFKELQVDLIFTSENSWETSRAFFAYNDLGNLMGKIYHRVGLKYGHTGLVYVFRNKDKVYRKTVICRNPKKIFEWIDLDYTRFLKGFDNVEDIFDYVIGSKYFNAESFYLENLDAKNRKRNRKRVNFMRFINYVAGTGEYSHREKSESKYVFDKDKEVYIDLLDKSFPDAKLKETKVQYEFEMENINEVRSKFNGNLVMAKFPELTGSTLGHWMGQFKECMSCDCTWTAYGLAHDRSEIMDHFTKFYTDKK